MASKASLSDRLVARLAGLSDAELDAVIEQGLELKADRGDNVARHCGAIYSGQRRSGSEPIDDAPMLAEVAALEQTGRGAAAVGIVARRHGTSRAEISTIARRLRRKRAEKKNGHPGAPRAAIK